MKKILSLSLICASLLGMEVPAEPKSPERIGIKAILQTTPEKDLYLNSNNDNISGSILNIINNKINAGDSISISAYMLTHKEIINGLKNAHERGALVDITVSHETVPQSGSHLAALTDAGINVTVLNIDDGKKRKLEHNKTIIFDYFNPQKKQKTKIAFAGSANFTHLAADNQESVIVSTQPEVIEKLTQYHETTTGYAQQFNTFNVSKPTLQKNCPLLLGPQKNIYTPEKVTAFTSLEKDYTQQIERHINFCRNEGDEIKLLTYTYNSNSLTNALEGLLKRKGKVSLFVDRITLADSNSQYQLKKLAQAKAIINVYYGENEFEKLHRKELWCKRKDNNTIKEYLIVSSANATYSDALLNTYVYLPGKENKDNIDKFHQTIANISHKFKSLEQALQLQSSNVPLKSARKTLTFNQSVQNVI